MNRHTDDVDIGGTGSISCVICMFDGGLSTTEDRWPFSVIFSLKIDDSLKVSAKIWYEVVCHDRCGRNTQMFNKNVY